MKITNLKIKNFRNYENINLNFSNYKNIIIGDNGMGKTNIVEAIYYLALTKSFRTNNEQVLIREGADYAVIEGTILNRIRNNYRSFKDIMLSIKSRLDKYIVNVDLNSVDLTHDYNLVKTYNYSENIEKSNEIINTKELSVDNQEIVNKHFSKSDKKIINIETKMYMELGTKIHELFEVIDFVNPDFDGLEENEILYIKNFLNQDVLKNIRDAKIYKEYEFMYEEDNVNYHGIIDLMLVYDNHIDIIDYKLMNTTSEEYVNQLNGYKGYIEKSFGKTVNLYLYSIVNNEIKTL